MKIQQTTAELEYYSHLTKVLHLSVFMRTFLSIKHKQGIIITALCSTMTDLNQQSAINSIIQDIKNNPYISSLSANTQNFQCRVQ